MKDNKAKKYNRIKLWFGIGKGIATFLLILAFVMSGLSELLVNYLSGFIENQYLLFIIFSAVSGLAASVLFFPVNFYTEFILEHKYELSNQTFGKWIREDLKGALVGGVIGLPVLLVFFYSLNKFGSLWWLPFAVILFLFSVILARIVPVWIMPLFYKITPVENDELRERILTLSVDAGLKVENVFRFDMSKNTKKANAAFTGLGKTKRILLGDTLLDGYDNDEIETVIAHELGHYKRKHIVKNIIISTVSSFLVFFLIAYFYEISIAWFGFSEITQIAALPLLTLWAMLLGLIQSPLSNMLSRKFEYEADTYAVASTKKKEAFIRTLDKLNDQNLGDKDPHPFVEWFFYSHPSVKKRIEFINSLK